MRFKPSAWVAICLMAAVALSGCNIGATPAPTIDVNAIYTQAAQTAIAGFSAQMTQTAQAMPPTALATNTPLATFTMLPTFPPLGTVVPGTTALPGTTSVLPTPLGLGSPTAAVVSCNNSAFMGETIPDGTVFKPGADFTKTWTLQNTGTCKWDDGYVFAFVAGDKLDGYDVALKKSSDFIDPGESITFSIDMTAHIAENTYEGCWKMKDDQGYFFGTFACVNIVVKK